MVALLPPLTAEATVEEGSPAGLASRTAAAVIDFVAVVAGLFAGYLVVSAVKFVANPPKFTFPAPPWEVMVTLGGVLAVVYLTVCWSTSGRTYGDLVFGVRVVGRSGGHLGPVTALARAVFYLALPEGLLLVGLDRRRRSLQDIVFRSTVVYDWSDV